MAANTIRLLIAGSQAGSLIGMSGQNIEKLRNSSGATITILAPNQLPLCASAHESDRVVQVSLSALIQNGDVAFGTFRYLRLLVDLDCKIEKHFCVNSLALSYRTCT